MNTKLLKLLAQFETKFIVAEVLVSIYHLLDNSETDKVTKAYLNELGGLMTQSFAYDNAYPISPQDFRSLRAWTRKWVPNPKETPELIRIRGLTPEKLEELRKDCFQKQMALMEVANQKRRAQINRARAKAESLRT